MDFCECFYLVKLKGLDFTKKNNDFIFFRENREVQFEATEADQDIIVAGRPMSYQASSPDEVALVQWSEEMGLALIERTLTTMKLRTPEAEIAGYSILQIFPFTSETKRMGIIVKDEKTNEIIVYMKGKLVCT